MAVHSSFSRQVVSAIRSVVGPRDAPLHEPSFDGKEWLYVKECLDSTYVSSVGEFVNRFETQLTDYTGAKYAVAVVTGTAALHVSLLLSGVMNDDEVLIPALTFVATANSVAYCNAVPHFVDSEESTLGVDVIKLREYLRLNTIQKSGKCINRMTNRVIRALVVMHTFGHPADIEGLIALSQEFNIVLVEDAAESLGSFYHGKHTGTFGMLGALSFNGNKIITTGGGGAILTDSLELAKRAKHITTTAKLPHAWEFRHDQIAYNYRLPNLNAALGCAQLENLSSKLTNKRDLFQKYKIALSGVHGLRLISEPKGCQSNYWLQTILLDENFKNRRDEILSATNSVGIMTRPAWELMHHLGQFKECPRMDLTKAESLSSRLINIPSSSDIAAGLNDEI